MLFVLLFACVEDLSLPNAGACSNTPDGTYELVKLVLEHVLPPNVSILLRENQIRPMTHQKRMAIGISILSIAIPTCLSQVALFKYSLGRYRFG